MNPALSMHDVSSSRKGGVKRPFVPITLFFTLGILASGLLKPSFQPASIAASLLFLILGLAFSNRSKIFHINLYIALFFLGMCVYSNFNALPPGHISNFTEDEGRRVLVRGVIASDPIVDTAFYRTEKAAFLLSVYSIKAEGGPWREMSGLVKTNVYKNEKNFSYGDTIIAEGIISRPGSLKNPGLFDYSKYLERKRVYAVLKIKDGSSIVVVGTAGGLNPVKSAAYRLRQEIGEFLDAYLKRPYSGFMKAILIGDRSGLNDSLKDDFVKTGTVHIIAISGLNIGLIAIPLLFVFGILRIPRKVGLLLAMVFAAFYSTLAGSDPSIVRATIMFCVFGIGRLIDRESDILNSLSIAAFAILAFDPNALRDPGFQLSFVSILSIVLFATKIEAVLNPGAGSTASSRASGIRSYTMKGVSVSIAAWLGTAPFVALYFNIISPVAILANIVVIPTLFVLMVAALLFLSVGAAANVFAPYLALALNQLCRFLFFANHLFSEIPFSHFRIAAPSAIFLFSYYAVIASALIFPNRKKRILTAALIIVNVAVWKNNIDAGKGIPKITFLDVGQGDSALIELPGNIRILIDGGSGGQDERFDMGRAVIAPYLWNRSIVRLDAVIATHFHEDHLGGLIYILKNFDIGCVIDNGAIVHERSGLYDEYKKVIREKKIIRLTAREGLEIAPLGRSVRLLILNPRRQERSIYDSNDNSIVAKLIYKSESAIFCGDITASAMERMSSYGALLQSDIMKVPHHGGILGDDETVANFFKKISPEISVVSVGRGNQFKAPAEKTINIITYLGSRCYATKDSGAIEIFLGTDFGKKIRIKEKKPTFL